MRIHPFIDGNGRTSRLLSTLSLYRAGYDFKKLFSISEYYDRDRSAFYAALQGVREAGMDLTEWLEYFVEGLSTQLQEVRNKGETAIRRDALALQHGLPERQAKLVGLAMEGGDMTIGDILRAYPDFKRRTAQRDLKQLVDMGLLAAKGSNNNLVYRLRLQGENTIYSV